jgi:SulP family sulfate permease
VLIGSRRLRHWALIPGSILVAITLFYGGVLLTQTPLAIVTAQGWLLEIPAEIEPWRPLSPLAITQVDWLLLVPQTWGILSVALITVISMLLNSSGIEVSTQRDIELNQELKAVGIGNVLTGLGGGLVGFHGVSVSLLMDKIGSRGRLSGLVAVGVTLAVLMAGTSVIALIPKFLLGGLVAFLGLSLLLEWLYDAWFKLTLADYLNVVMILGVIVFVGFLPGVAYGIMVAAILFVINYSRTAVSRHPLTGTSYRSRVRRLNSHERILRKNGEQIHILQLQGLLFFGTGSQLLAEVKDRLTQPDLKPLKILVLDFRLVSGIDSSAVVSFVKLRYIAEKNDFILVFTSLPDTVEGLLRQGGALTTDDPNLYVFPDLDRGAAWCEDFLLKQSNLRRSRAMPLFIQLKATFPAPDLVPLLMQSYLVPMQLDPGENLFQRGDAYDGLYFLESGQITLLDPLPNGSIERVATYNRGTTIGERGLYQKSTHRFSAVADTKSRLYFLPTNALERMEERHPQLASALHRFVVQSMADRLDYRDQEIQELLK